ncbi:MAG TPA: hypothetical protein VFC73_01710 [Syntrophomonadaceae bacterium]|nr:hypothetical protein [Syntrophomonadaceae bacterium]
MLSVETPAMGTEWQIIWDEDSTIVENVQTSNEDLAANLCNWGFVAGNSKGTFSRHTADWNMYNSLEGKFPITVTTKNRGLFAVSVIGTDNNLATDITKDLAEPINLQITVPGFYIKNTGERISGTTSQWKLMPGWTESYNKDYLTKCIVFDGLILGLSTFLLGIFVIILLFFRATSRVDNIIEEEYSIENYLAEQAEINENKKDDK